MSRWMALPLLLGLSVLSVACDPATPEVDEELEGDQMMEGEEMEESEGSEEGGE